MNPAAIRPTRSLFVALWIAASLGGVGLVIQPVSMASIRAAELLALFIFLAGAFVLVWRRNLLRWTALTVVAVPLLALLIPGRDHDRESLQSAMVNGLKAYDRTPYVWGGENGRGIDCSGLVRRGMIDACLREGLQTLNPSLLRAAVDIWWHDCSARAMRDGYRGMTRPIGSADTINSIRAGTIRAGDIAVTANGVHVLAFLGDGAWAQAAPDVGHAAIFSTPSRNEWFDQPVVLVRWTMLQP